MIYGAQDILPIDISVTDAALTVEAYALRATGAGNIAIKTRAEQVRVLPFLAGETRYIYTSLIYKSGTTATGIEALLPPT